MSKTIKVIDLLNKIANGEDVPKKIRFDNKTYWLDGKEYVTIGLGDYTEYFIDNIDDASQLNCTVEIIEEEPEIDIQGIEELPFDTHEIEWEDVRDTTNELIKAIKQLDNQINNK